MELKKITISIPIMLYKKAKRDAELKGYQDFDEFMINLIRYEVFSIKKEIPCKQPSQEDIKVLSENFEDDLDDETSQYFSEQIKRDLSSRGFGGDK